MTRLGPILPSIPAATSQAGRVPLVRILVDGYSLLHAWPALAPGQARHSAAARDELIRVLRRYDNGQGTPLTVVFDGMGSRGRHASDTLSTPECEILYSKNGQTADDIIERVATRLTAYGEVLVVTNDRAERDTIMAAGAQSIGCEHFIHMLRAAAADLNTEVGRHNRTERQNYRRQK